MSICQLSRGINPIIYVHVNITVAPDWTDDLCEADVIQQTSGCLKVPYPPAYTHRTPHTHTVPLAMSWPAYGRPWSSRTPVFPIFQRFITARHTHLSQPQLVGNTHRRMCTETPQRSHAHAGDNRTLHRLAFIQWLEVQNSSGLTEEVNTDKHINMQHLSGWPRIQKTTAFNSLKI